MTIIELIWQLEQIMNKYGDIEVKVSTVETLYDITEVKVTSLPGFETFVEIKDYV